MKSALVLALLGLTACARPAPTIAEFQAVCARYGYAAGTPEQAACVERSVTAYNDRIAAANTAQTAALLGYSAAMTPRPMPMQSAPLVPMQVQSCMPTVGGGFMCNR